MKQKRINRLFLRLIILLVIVTPLIFGQDSRIQQMIDSVSETNLLSHINALTQTGGFRSRMNFTTGNDSARFYIEETFRNIPGLSVELDSFFVPAQPPYDQSPLYNIVAMLPGKKDSSEYIVIGGHYDSIAGSDSGWVDGWYTMPAPGADDNASGVAAVLELARIFADGTSGYSNDFPIYFVAFAGEEGTTPPYNVYSYFLNGSKHFAQTLKNQGVEVRGMINLDMIGYNDRCLYANIEADSQSTWLGEKSLDLNTEYQIGLILNAPPFPAHQWSDHGPFWMQGYSAILLIESYDVTKDYDTLYRANTNYHRHSDTTETLNPQLIKTVARLALATAATIAIDTGSATGVTAGVAKDDPSLSVAVFPNPFNPTTTIRVSIALPSVVSLKVFDLLGREVATLVKDEYKPKGQFQVRWNASLQSSGVYFAQLKTENHVLIHKLMLVR